MNEIKTEKHQVTSTPKYRRERCTTLTSRESVETELEQGGLEPHAHPTSIPADMGQLPTDGNFSSFANQIKTSTFHFDKKYCIYGISSYQICYKILLTIYEMK